jgi:hypothetical protein
MHFEKCLKRPFSSFSQAFSEMPRKAFEGIFPLLKATGRVRGFSPDW